MSAVRAVIPRRFAQPRRWWGMLLCLMFTTAAWAGGPRFVGGTTFCCYAGGNWMGWYTSPQYFTDPGNLAATVSHAQADAMVAAAAKVWNVPTAWITLTQGGVLNEQVSSANTYFDGTQMVFPTDVMAANYAAKQIAVIYDRDGSVTDTMLGSGASSPSGCRQTGVTESVDSFASNGLILHAVIVLNGRCVGSTAQQLTQMQYQLTRVFGRVLGLAWSQLNDNVFTGASTPTAVQMQYWPLMHPMDVVCGPYTYLCMQNPFALRVDDLSALGLLYPVSGTGGGKTPTLANAVPMLGWVSFPDGQGMELTNVTVVLSPSVWGTWEAWQTVSGVSGILYQQNGGNPVTGVETDAQNVGTTFDELEGKFNIGAIPLSASWTGMSILPESINSLYWGEYSLGPYERPPVSISGSGSSIEPFAAAGSTYGEWITMGGAPTGCAAGGNGTPGAAVSVDASGWWKSAMCPTGFSSWWTVTVKANRTYTLETTALDETGAATLSKLQPVIGVWDPTGQIGMAGAPMNSLAPGMTQLQMAAVTTGTSDDALLVGVADLYGAGRPDFAYQTRLLYADSLTPSVLGTSGGQIVITGMGFRAGNRVMVNGVYATVVSATSTQIVALTPTMAAAGALAGTAVDVAVVDTSTAGSTVMQGALVYGGSGIDGIQVVTAPAALETGVVASVPFEVKVVAADGVTAVKGASVRFGLVSGSVVMGCGASCVITTDANGLAQTTLAGGAAGAVVVSATELSGGATVKVTLKESDPVRSVSIAPGAVYLAAGSSAQWTLTLTATQDGSLAVGAPVAWSGTGLSVTPARAVSGAAGTATAVASAVSIAGASKNTVTGCAWTTVCANWTAYGVDASSWTVAVESGGSQTVKAGTTLGAVGLLVTDGAGHPVAGAPVTVYQTVYAWEGSCVAARCAAAPVLQTSQVSAMSDANGVVAVTPLQVKGQPEVVQVAASTGTKGFATATLTVQP